MLKVLNLKLKYKYYKLKTTKPLFKKLSLNQGGFEEYSQKSES